MLATIPQSRFFMTQCKIAWNLLPMQIWKIEHSNNYKYWKWSKILHFEIITLSLSIPMSLIFFQNAKFYPILNIYNYLDDQFFKFAWVANSMLSCTVSYGLDLPPWADPSIVEYSTLTDPSHPFCLITVATRWPDAMSPTYL